jgi:flagellar assembly factor FliW
LKYIDTSRFGRLAIEENSIITFPTGLTDHGDLREFAIVGIEDYFPFLIFASLDNTGICFPIVNPVPIFPDYKPEIPSTDLKHLGIKKVGDIQLYCLVTFSSEPGKTFVNMRNPLVINVVRMVGCQVDLPGEEYHRQAPLELSQIICRSNM